MSGGAPTVKGVNGWRGGSPGCWGHGLGASVGEAGTGHGDGARELEPACEGGQQGGEGEERTGGGASCQHAQKEILEGWGLEAVITGAVLSCPPPIPVEAALSALCWPRDVPTTPLWPLPFFPFIFIYLLTFMKFPFHPNPIARVVLTIPPTSAIQLSVQLSVCHKENKNGKQQHLCVVYGEEWLGAQGAGCAGTGAFQPSLGQ